MTLSQALATVFFISYFLVAGYVTYTGHRDLKEVFAFLTLILLLGSGVSGEHYWPFWDWHFMSSAQEKSATMYDISLVGSSGKEYTYPYWEAANGYLAFPSIYNQRLISRERKIVPEACYFLREGKEWYSRENTNKLSYLRFPPHLDYSKRRVNAKIKGLKFYKVYLDLDSGKVVRRDMIRQVYMQQCS